MTFKPDLKELKSFYPQSCLADLASENKHSEKSVLFSKDIYPELDEEEEDLSVDVFTIDENNHIGVAYFDFKIESWVHLVEDTDEFKWQYKPEELTY